MDAEIKEEKKGKRKWGKIIYNFLIMGGWLLVAVLILAIAITISVLSK